MQIAIFGGSFNPPHLGHFLSAQQLVDFGFIDQVWLMPCYAHVWNKKLALIEHRLKMTKFLENEKIKVSELEIKEKKPVYTIETMELLKKKHPRHYFSLIIGEKSLKELSKWKDYKRLIKNYKFLVVPQNSSNTSHPRPRRGEAEGGQSSIIKPISHPLWVTTGVSSSIIRKRVKKGISIVGLVPGKVREYIKKNKLYH